MRRKAPPQRHPLVQIRRGRDPEGRSRSAAEARWFAPSSRVACSCDAPTSSSSNMDWAWCRDRWPFIGVRHKLSGRLSASERPRHDGEAVPCVRVEGTWFNTGGAKGSAMTVGGLDMCGCSESNMTSLAGFVGGPAKVISPPPESLPKHGLAVHVVAPEVASRLFTCENVICSSGLMGYSNIALLVRLARYRKYHMYVYVYG